MENNYNFQRNFNSNGNTFSGQSVFRNSYSSRQPSTPQVNTQHSSINETKINSLTGSPNEHAFHQNREEPTHTYKSIDGKQWATGSDALAANKQYFQHLIDESKKS